MTAPIIIGRTNSGLVKLPMVDVWMTVDEADAWLHRVLDVLHDRVPPHPRVSSDVVTTTTGPHTADGWELQYVRRPRSSFSFTRIDDEAAG